MADVSLTTAILRYKAAMYTHLAAQAEAEERGDTTDIPVDYWDVIAIIESWERPAANLYEAIDALDLALYDFEIGPTPRIPAMIKAALGWMKAEGKVRRAFA